MSSILIKNGIVYDGVNQEPDRVDVRIKDDIIVEMGVNLKSSKNEEIQIIDANGKVVTPGFVDIHRHCDKSPFDQERGVRNYGDVLLRQGITTTVVGNCGISMYPLSKNPLVKEEMRNYYLPVLGDISAYSEIDTYNAYVKKLEVCKLPVNTAAMIGLGAIRIAVKGFSKEPLSREEITVCQTILEEALRQGAPGVTIGLMYLPECYSTLEEVGEVLKPLGKYDRILCTHIRGEGDSLVKSVEEVIHIAKIAGCRLEISHFKSCGVINWQNKVYKAIALIEKARKEGQDVTCDLYPYDCGSTTLMSLIPPEFVNGKIQQMLQILKTSEGKDKLRQALKKTYSDWDNYVLSLGWDKAVISAVENPQNYWVIGKNISEITDEGGYADEIEAISELLISENGTVAMIIRSMNQKDVDTIARLPYSCFISDAIYAETARPHPRMYGAFSKVICDYAMKRKVISLGEAVCKITSIPACRMKLEKRGCLKEGYYADINIFDPMELKDQATYTEPARFSTGLYKSLINGQLVVDRDRVLNQMAGKFLKL